MKIFKEEQRFTQMWIIMLLIISMVAPVVLVINEFIKTNGDNDSIEGLVVVFISIVLVFGLVFSLKLITRIDEKGIYYRFKPFHFKTKFIEWSLIDDAFVRKYSPISEYGGWGIKGGKLWNKSKGVAYNVTGDIGLQLELKNGKKILIGTQKQDEMKRILNTYKDKLGSYEN